MTCTRTKPSCVSEATHLRFGRLMESSKADLVDVEIRLAAPDTSFTTGQDIEAPLGAPVVAGASGKISFVGWQNGYGQLVVVDHGGGLTTRYGHLSHIDVDAGQQVSRGQLVGELAPPDAQLDPTFITKFVSTMQPVNPLQYLLMSTKK